jgi:hypothetical protein
VVVVRAGYMYQVPAILIVVQWSSRKVCATLAEQVNYGFSHFGCFGARENVRYCS